VNDDDYILVEKPTNAIHHRRWISNFSLGRREEFATDNLLPTSTRANDHDCKKNDMRKECDIDGNMNSGKHDVENCCSNISNSYVKQSTVDTVKEDGKEHIEMNKVDFIFSID